MTQGIDARVSAAPRCPRCRTVMGIGLGINPTDPDWRKNGFGMPGPYITHETIRLDRVWKCRGCGHSADIVVMG